MKEFKGILFDFNFGNIKIISEKLFKEIVSELGSIYSNIPSETSLYNVEDKLEKI